ncbi:MAG: UDP-N-acetylmuramoyl-L-alanyl-D-glutamate--2,6-diaminopimelate ligase [Clostridia bacterium]|nr:UDP-N-acetylmuramoyl-L-alanyl-D-glutamate--2,6-diaminopimelate ligase [Clostridia bacterium]
MSVYKKTLREIADFLGGVIKCKKRTAGEDVIYRIEYDSRKIISGDLFVCLVGARSDGHVFIPSAYRSGCRAFLCEHIPDDLPSDAAVILVENTRAALAKLSAFFYDYPADKLKLIGITGTKGKTTTALLTASILNKNGKNCAYIGSNGVIINGERIETVNTTPESKELHHYFAMMVDRGVKYAAIEVSSQGLAHNRVDGINFAVKVFTNLSPDHITDCEHKDFDDYKNAKASFFKGFDGDIIYNADDPESLSVISGHHENANLIPIGMGIAEGFSGIGGTPYRDSTTLGIEFVCKYNGIDTNVKLRSPGSFSVYNGLTAIACAERMGIDVPHSAAALAETSVMGRFEIVPGLPGRTYIVDYAHNGESMRRALAALREYSPTRLIVVFGSVGGRTFGRRKEMAEAASALADLSIITSDNPDFEPPMSVIEDIASHMDPTHPYLMMADREEAVRHAIRISAEGDIVLFAGKGHETYQLVNGKKIPFIESEIIRDECIIISNGSK